MSISAMAIESRFSVLCPASAWACRLAGILLASRKARVMHREQAAVVVWREIPDKSGEDTLKRPSMAWVGKRAAIEPPTG